MLPLQSLQKIFGIRIMATPIEFACSLVQLVSSSDSLYSTQNGRRIVWSIIPSFQIFDVAPSSPTTAIIIINIVVVIYVDFGKTYSLFRAALLFQRIYYKHIQDWTVWVNRNIVLLFSFSIFLYTYVCLLFGAM